MRYAWLPLLLLVALPLSAQEYQVIITGQTAPDTGPSAAFDISFDFNALSPTQAYTSSGGCLQSFSATVPITGLSVTVGGAAFPLSGSSMSFSGGPLTSGSCLLIESYLTIGAVGQGGFIANLAGLPPSSLGTYPLVTLLQTQSDNGGGGLGDMNLQDISISVEPVSVGVPEPGTLGLLAFAVLGLLAVHARRAFLPVTRS